jgi:hypothetical protein
LQVRRKATALSVIVLTCSASLAAPPPCASSPSPDFAAVPDGARSSSSVGSFPASHAGQLDFANFPRPLPRHVSQSSRPFLHSPQRNQPLPSHGPHFDVEAAVPSL